MSDIVERLNLWVVPPEKGELLDWYMETREAIREIERLRAELAERKCAVTGCGMYDGGEMQKLRAERDDKIQVAATIATERALLQIDHDRLRAERDALLAQQKALFAGGRPLDELVADAERWQWALRNAAKAAKLLDDWDMDGGDNADDINQAVSLEIAALAAAEKAQQS